MPGDDAGRVEETHGFHVGCEKCGALGGDGAWDVVDYTDKNEETGKLSGECLW